jgi:C1A family cysteine protease
MLGRIPSVLQPGVKKNAVVPSKSDRRDHRLKLLNSKAKLPVVVNLKADLPYVFDQGAIGSCTANSAGSMYSWVVHNQTKGLFVPSRLFLYYNTRLIQGTVSYDSGASLRATMQSLRNNGVCAETTWPYEYSKLFETPSPSSYAEGSENQALSYAAVPITLIAMKNVVRTRPFVLGILVYSSFFYPAVAKTGRVPVPNVRNESLLGGHAILVLGYDDRRKSFFCRNSWGTSWGLRGDFYLPYEYATNRKLAFDAWVLYSVELPLANARVVTV